MLPNERGPLTSSHHLKILLLLALTDPASRIFTACLTDSVPLKSVYPTTSGPGLVGHKTPCWPSEQWHWPLSGAWRWWPWSAISEPTKHCGDDPFKPIPGSPPAPKPPQVRPSTLGLPEEFCGQAPLNNLGLDDDDGADTDAPYLVNGEDQEYGEFPSFARLEIDKGDNMIGICGGTLISDRHVLTAAHCLQDNYPGKPPRLASAHDVLVRLGEHRLYVQDQFEQETRAGRICRSPDYPTDQAFPTYDWAVIELAEPVEFTSHVQPACLPRGSEQPVTRGSSSNCYAVGLGATGFEPGKYGPRPKKPRVVQKLEVEQVSCAKWRITDEDKSRVCYSRARGQQGDACQGDSGGPILCADQQRRWTVTAAVSYGTRWCDDRAWMAWIGVYADIRKLLGNMDRHCMGAHDEGRPYKGNLTRRRSLFGL